MTDRYKVQPIGNVDLADGGVDRYILITDREDDIESERQIIDEFMPHYYFDGGPGREFCHSMRVILDPIHDNKCIAIVHWRMDI